MVIMRNVITDTTVLTFIESGPVPNGDHEGVGGDDVVQQPLQLQVPGHHRRLFPCTQEHRTNIHSLNTRTPYTSSVSVHRNIVHTFSLCTQEHRTHLQSLYAGTQYTPSVSVHRNTIHTFTFMEKEDRGQGTYSMLHNYQTPVDRQGHVKEKQNSLTSTSEVLLLTTDTFYMMSEVALGAKAVERAWRTEIKRAEFSVAREARRARF